MTPKPLVTADELLDLSDTVSRLADVADAAGQIAVHERLAALLPNIIDAAKSAALRAVQDRRASLVSSATQGSKP